MTVPTQFTKRQLFLISTCCLLWQNLCLQNFFSPTDTFNAKFNKFAGPSRLHIQDNFRQLFYLFSLNWIIFQEKMAKSLTALRHVNGKFVVSNVLLFFVPKGSLFTAKTAKVMARMLKYFMEKWWSDFWKTSDYFSAKSILHWEHLQVIKWKHL